jgi:hypothetical protein
VDSPIGLWSADAAGLHYSSFENETFALEQGGVGWLRFERPGYRDLIQFAWSLEAPQRIALTYQGRRETVDDTTRDVVTDALPTRLRYHIAVEDTPLAGRTTLLHIDPPILLTDIFGRQSRHPTRP